MIYYNVYLYGKFIGTAYKEKHSNTVTYDLCKLNKRTISDEELFHLQLVPKK